MESFFKRTLMQIGLVLWLKGIAGVGQGNANVTLTAPSPVPLLHNGSFTCQILQNGSNPIWILKFPDSQFLIYPVNCVGVCTANNIRNVYYTFDRSTSSSTLIILGTGTYNGTEVSCYELRSSESGPIMETKKFSVYGPPPPPSVISIVHHNLTTLNISWSASYSAFNIPTAYSLIARVRGGIMNVIRSNISSQYYLYSPAQICGEMSFSIYSSNSAGLSKSSTEEKFFSQIITNLREVSSSISHAVTKHVNGTELTIFLKLPSFCLHYRKTKVNILLTSFTPVPSSQVYALDVSAVPIKVKLEDNAVYSYSLFVRHNLTIYESDQNIYTTDVIPPAIICVDKEKEIVELQCNFHNYSKARGCIVYVNSSPHFIERKGTVASSYLSLPNAAVVGVNFTVLDWTKNGPEKKVAIPVQIIHKSIPTTTTTRTGHGNVGTGGLTPTRRRTLIAGVVLGSIALIVISAVVIAIIIAYVFYHVKPRKQRQKGVQGVQGVQSGAKTSDNFCTPSCMSLTASPSPSPSTMYTMIQGSSLTAINYAPTASTTHSTASQAPPSPVTYPSLSASLARDASPPTPASTNALHVHFSLRNPNSVESSFATYDVPSHSPPLPVNQYQDVKAYEAQQASYALYDQLPRSANGSPSYPAAQDPNALPLPVDLTPVPPPVPPTPPPPPLTYFDRLSSTPELPDFRAPSPEYVAMGQPEEQTCSNSMHSKSPDCEDFSSAVPFTSSNFYTHMFSSHAPSAT